MYDLILLAQYTYDLTIKHEYTWGFGDLGKLGMQSIWKEKTQALLLAAGCQCWFEATLADMLFMLFVVHEGCIIVWSSQH